MLWPQTIYETTEIAARIVLIKSRKYKANLDLR